MRTLFVIAVVLFTNFSWGRDVELGNGSFEMPYLDPAVYLYPAIPMAPLWTELDVDVENSQNTGIFRNSEENSVDRIVNAAGKQLAFLGSQTGNGFIQMTAEPYRVGRSYRLSVGTAVSMRFAPPAGSVLRLGFYYQDGGDPNAIEIVSRIIPVVGQSSTELQEFSVDLPEVRNDDPWAAKTVGVGIWAEGPAGGFWDLDNFRLTASQPTADFDGENGIDLNDFAVMSAQWLAEGTDLGEMTDDRRVDLADLAAWIERLQYGTD